MLRRRLFGRRRGQSITEYVMAASIVSLTIFASMATFPELVQEVVGTTSDHLAEELTDGGVQE